MKLLFLMFDNREMKLFEEKKIRKIGIFRALYLGDMLCIVPFVRALRAAYPDAIIVLIGIPWEKEFVKRFSKYFNNFIEFPGWPGLPEQEPNQEKIVQFLELVRSLQLDLLIQMQGNGIITNSMCMLWGAKNVCGLRRENQYCADEKLFPISEDDDHEVLRFLKLADALQIPKQGKNLEFPFFDHELEEFEVIKETLGINSKQYICLHAGARDVRRRWSIDNFAFVANELASRGYTILLTGSLQEKTLLDDLEGKINYPVVNIINRLGDVGLGALALIIKHSGMLISNDTGVSHIASALKVPSVIIFSPYSSIERWAPLNRSLHHLIKPEESKNAEDVLNRVLGSLDSRIKESSSVLLD
jgi:ADP-heptose:LPS heptosyltransferase